MICRLRILSIWMSEVFSYGNCLMIRGMPRNHVRVCLFADIMHFFSTHRSLRTFASEKILWKKVKLLKCAILPFFHNVFYAICMLKSFNIHILVVVCSFFEFRTVSKWLKYMYVWKVTLKIIWPNYLPFDAVYSRALASTCDAFFFTKQKA